MITESILFPFQSFQSIIIKSDGKLVYVKPPHIVVGPVVNDGKGTLSSIPTLP